MTATDKTTEGRPGDIVHFAIRAGCEAANIHLVCAYPGCSCKQIPAAIKAARPILLKGKLP